MIKQNKKGLKAKSKGDVIDFALTVQEMNLNLGKQLDAAQDKFLNASMELELLKERYENATILKIRD